MKITVARSAGFCSGVKRALTIALATARSGHNVEMLGDIVHNEEVVQDISRHGIKKVVALTPGSGKTLLIRAHGAGEKTYTKAHALGYRIIDATCPMVKEIHRIAKNCERKGYAMIIIGDKKHDEVTGIKGQLRDPALVIDSIKHIPAEKIKKMRNVAVVVQSTQNLEKTLRIVDALRKYAREVHFFNTICKPTQHKQREIHLLPRQNDIMLIIGSKTSANTKRLYQIAKALNKRSFWIQTKNDIKPCWFRKVKSVGITAGASTPDYTTREVVQYIKNITVPAQHATLTSRR